MITQKRLRDSGVFASAKVMYSNLDDKFYEALYSNDGWVWIEVSQEAAIASVKAGWTMAYCDNIITFAENKNGI